MPKARSKPLVFISHVTADADIAKLLKGVFETHFLGMIEVFVSSDGHSIPLGQKWLDSISSALHRCVIQIVICSPASITRPWVNFEAGAGWVRDVPIVPICHSGLSPHDLPIPLNLLQATKATDEAGLQFVIHRLAEAIHSKIPDVDFGPFIEKVRQLESRPPRTHRHYTAGADIQKDISSLIISSNKHIYAIGVHFNICLSDRRRDYLTALSSGVDITIAILDPECEALDITARTFGMEVGELRSECRTGLDIMRSFRDQYGRIATAPGAGRLTQITYTHIPRGRFYIFDEQSLTGYVLFTPYVNGLRSSESPTYGFPSSEPAAQKYMKSCLEMMSSGRPVG